MKTISLFVSLFLLIQGISAQDVYEQQRASWMEKAEAARPQLKKTVYYPLYLVKSVSDPAAYQSWRMEKSEGMNALYDISFKQKKECTVDFGRHMTGYYSFKLTTLSRTQDAPVRIKFTFGEVPAELNTPFDPFPGTLSRAWLQDEVITITEIDKYITIPRRLAGRYVKIELMGASNDFDFALTDMYFTATTSVSDMKLNLLETASQEIRDIDRISIETLKECMQTVYEDGPKRDQRLWIGDLYLESLANTYSFKQFDLTKHCLYLLAGLSAEDGRLHANVFEYPKPHPQFGSFCLTYSLLYNVTLLEYLRVTNDRETALDLWPVVKTQIADALSYLNDDYIFNKLKKNSFVWLFFDWREGLDDNTPIQGLLPFALEQSYELAKMLGKESEVKEWLSVAKKMKQAARKQLYKAKAGYFVSGTDQQISVMSQIWMILSETLNAKEGRKALETVMSMSDAVRLGAPYAYHYLVEAMIKCKMDDEAKQLLIDYWGGMVKKGADTFWEVYDPKDDYLSPYNFFPMNSYCHAWSCTPVYFIHKYPDIFQK